MNNLRNEQLVEFGSAVKVGSIARAYGRHYIISGSVLIPVTNKALSTAYYGDWESLVVNLVDYHPEKSIEGVNQMNVLENWKVRNSFMNRAIKALTKFVDRI